MEAGAIMFNVAQKTMVLKWQASEGQALIELAVFGAIFLMVLSVMIRYGLQYNLQQKAEMTAFRRAMAIASSDVGGAPAGSGAYSLRKKVYLPDITKDKVAGTAVDVGASAAVQRNPLQFYTSTTPSLDISDSQTMLRVNSAGVAKNFMRLATWGSGFRVEHGVSQNDMLKYTKIFNLLVRNAANNDWALWNNETEDMEDEYLTTCLHTHQVAVGYGFVDVCDEYGLTVRVEDPCLAEIPSYSTCEEIAMRIVDEDYCRSKCKVSDACSTLSTATARNNCNNECDAACLLETNPPNQHNSSYDDAVGGAWYATGYHRTRYSYSDGSARNAYTFPVLDDLFNSSSMKSMGVGGEGRSTMDNTKNETFRKRETPTQFRTDESSISSEFSYSNITRQDNLDAHGEQINRGSTAAYAGNVTRTPLTTEMTLRFNQTWQTNK